MRIIASKCPSRSGQRNLNLSSFITEKFLFTPVVLFRNEHFLRELDMFPSPTENKTELAIVSGIGLRFSHLQLISDPKIQVETLRPQSFLRSQ